MTALANPERAWAPPAEVRAVTRDEVERRIGPVASFEPLAGGLANANVRVGGGRVLRLYRRDPRARATEEALLRRPWRSFVVPAVLGSGDDHLLLEEVPHAPLEDSAEHGAAIGRALAEIHRAPPDGLERFVDPIAALAEYALARVADPELRERLRAFIAAREPALRAVAGVPVLLHADFKASNLHWARGRPLVLDWEFAWAGPALLDVGQLVRWGPSPAFRVAFAGAYREGGGALPRDWADHAQAFDAFYLAGLLERSPPGSRRERDVTARLRSTIGS